MVVKTRKQGNSITIAVPSKFNIGADVEFHPTIDVDGVLSYVPVHMNMFEANPDYDLRAAMEADGITDNGKLVGKENVW